MKIAVCIKQVPARDSILRLHENSRWIRESDLSFEMNEPDAYALETALQLKEKHGGEVVVISLGPARVQQTIREALAKGADRAIHVTEEPSSRVDSLGPARMIAEAIRKDAAGGFDLILTGLQSDDFGFGQTGVILAELLGIPHATIVMEVQVDNGHLRVKRELEAGWFQWIKMPLPALLTIQSGISKLRYATLMGIKKAKSKEIRQMTGSQLGVPTAVPGQKLLRVYAPVRNKKTQFLEGSAKEAAAALVEKLRHGAHVL
jgi:electron transfer flavoprotein beta subunit